MQECWFLFDKSGFAVGPFWSWSAVLQHLDGLGAGKGTPDNEHIRSQLEAKRFVEAETMEAA
jgi:hypothetical protein